MTIPMVPQEDIPPQPLLEAHQVTVRIGDRDILHEIDLSIAPKEIVTLIGPNGAGKTTFLRVLLGVIQPASGRIVRLEGLRIGYVPQRLFVDPVLPLTVRRFLSLGQSRGHGEPLVALEEVGGGRLIGQMLHELSGGEFQRVLLARALLRDPDLLILDEPVQGVDFGGQFELYDLIRRIRDQRGCSVILVSHDLHLVMASTDRVVCIDREVRCSGVPEMVVQHPAYVDLFGRRSAGELAVYKHEHNNAHTVSPPSPPQG